MMTTPAPPPGRRRPRSSRKASTRHVTCLPPAAPLAAKTGGSDTRVLALLKPFCRLRATVEISLELVRAHGGEGSGLIDGLDALGRDGGAQQVTGVDDELGQRRREFDLLFFL